MGTNMSVRRYILFLVTALSVLLGVSCSKIEDQKDDGWAELWSDAPVVFRSSLSETTTKSQLPSGTHFGVFAFYQQGVIGGEAGSWTPLEDNHWKPNFMFNQEVVFNGSSYTYAPIKYWPNNNENTLTFWGYCPYVASPALYVSGTSTSYDNTSEQIPDLGFTVSDGSIDFMVSNVVADQHKPAIGESVNIPFNHALSKIDFKFNKVNDSGDAYKIKVTSISFININLTGIHGSAGWRDWSNPCDNEHPFVAYSGDPIDVKYKSTDTPDFPESPNCSVMLIPQDVGTNNAILRINYSVSLGSNPAQQYEGECLLTGSWLEEKQHTYKISISPGNPIIFSASITPWDENVVNGYKYIVN